MEKATLIKIRKIAIAIALCFVICGMAVRPALADDDHHGRGERHHDEGHDRDRDRGGTYYYAPQPSYYYAPQPNYYYAPEPDQYYYTPQPQYYPPPPSEGNQPLLRASLAAQPVRGGRR
jgi:uncharacterized protein DUF3824